MECQRAPQILLIEGIQGAGKSTLAKAMARELRTSYPDARIYLRSSKPNPIDVCRLARFSPEEYWQFCAIVTEECGCSVAQVSVALTPYAAMEDGQIYVNWYDALSRLEVQLPRAMAYALEHELCDGKAGRERYQAVTRNRWARFAEHIDPRGIYLFEGVLFQHPLAELMGYYQLCDGEIEAYLNSLLICLRDISVQLYYLSVANIGAVLSAAAAQRQEESYDWLKGFVKLAATCPYGVRHGLSGLDGAIRYCTERVRIETKLLKKLDIPVTVIARDETKGR